MKSHLPLLLILILTNSGSLLGFDHALFNQLLQQHVSIDGKVNYKGFQADRSKLDLYLDQLKNAKAIESWNKEEQLAFYINAYNSFTIQLILDHYPVKSINDIAQPWDKKFFTIQGKKMSLNELEHEILRKKFDEPRIHFAIVCASFSCPQLRNEAFIANKINSQLEDQTRKFLSDKKRNLISGERAEVSKIFSWFKADFTKNGSLVDFINEYAEVKISKKTKIRFLPYNWSLNE